MSPLASGLAGQIGFADEVTYGTYVAPTRFLEFLSESLVLERERIESAGIRAGRRVLHRWAAGVQRVTGDVVFEVAPQGFGLIWKHILGGVATTGAGPYTHTFTPGDLAGKSLSVQVGRPDIAGVVRPFSYLGCKVASAELGFEVNQYAQLTCSFYGAHEDTAQTLGVATYPTGLAPFSYNYGAITIAAGAFDVKSGSLSIDNGLATDRHFIRATTPERPKEPLEADRRAITGTLTADFTDLTAYNRFVNGTEAALVLDFNVGASARLTATLNVRFDGTTPNVGGAELLEQELPWKAVSATSDAAAITVVLINSDAAP
jgi:hypothetical protein